MTNEIKLNSINPHKAAWRLGGQIVKGHAMIASLRHDIERETDPGQIERLLSITKLVEAVLDEIGADRDD